MFTARIALISALAACANAPEASREQRILDALAEENYATMLREPNLVALKLVKMQRGPYEWLRGTASLYWRDLTEPGAPRAATTFGDPLSSRVLLVGDPHPENVGTFRAADGTMFADWNDFDATGYGPFTGDLRRLATGFVIIARIAGTDETYARGLATRAARGYAIETAALAAGQPPITVGMGRHPYITDEMDTAKTRGDRNYNLDEVAPVMNGVRAVRFTNLEPIAADGVLEDTVFAVDAQTADTIDRAIAQWRTNVGLSETEAAVKLRGRRIGSGVSSYPVLRWFAVLEGPTTATDDDHFIELKETREGVIVRGLPQNESGEWASPAARAVDTQLRLQARGDGDALLGAAHLGGLSLKIRDREAYQRGLDAGDMADLAGGNAGDRADLESLAELLGRMLARAHGRALTGDRSRGVDVIAPVIAGRDAAFEDEMATLAIADADQIAADHGAMKDRDLAAAIRGAR